MMTIARTTNAADGLARRAFTVAEIEAMVEAGIIPPDERFELIGGEVVPMAAKGARHEILKAALLRHWMPRCPPDVLMIPETTLRLSPDTFVEPDIAVFDDAHDAPMLVPARTLLAVEIAESSLGYDLGRKSALYAAAGIVELWVIDARRLRLHVHADPVGDTYRDLAEHGPDVSVVPRRLPGMALALRDISARLSTI